MLRLTKPVRITLLWLFLFAYLVAGLYTELRLVEIKPIPIRLLEDFGYYKNALGQPDPYANRDIGTGFLYPLPSLLIVEGYCNILPDLFQAAVYTVMNVLLMVFMVYGVAHRYGYSVSDVWWWFPLGLGFAPFLELLHVGQINMITQFGVFLMFFWELGRPYLAGLGLSLGVITKVTPLAFVGYLLVTRRFKVVAGTVVGVLLLSLYAGLKYGFDPLWGYVDVFQTLLDHFPLDVNAQSLVAKLTLHKWVDYADIKSVHRVLTLYILAVFIVSGVITYFLRQREPLFIIVGLGIMLSPNIMWYHHYVFILLPLFVWLGWKRLDPRVVLWCLLGLFVTQLDRRHLTYGLLVHVFAHLSILVILAWQIRQAQSFWRAKRAVSAGSV
jgi:hypothetical protein